MSEPEDPCGRPPDKAGGAPGISITVSGMEGEIADDLIRAARLALTSHGIEVGRVDIAVVDEAEMRAQHAHWMGDDSATDSLAFDLRDDPSDRAIDAQLVVCETVARQRAAEAGHEWRDELMLYVIHGSLHLCGYEDQDAKAAALMHVEEDRLLVELGRSAVFAIGESRFGQNGKGEP